MQEIYFRLHGQSYMTFLILTEPYTITPENTVGAVLMAHKVTGQIVFWYLNSWVQISLRLIVTPGYCSEYSLVFIAFKTIIFNNNKTKQTNKQKTPILLLRDAVFVNLVKQVILDVKQRYALPVYGRKNIHVIEDEHLVLTIEDQLCLEMLLFEIRGSCICYVSYEKKASLNKKERKFCQISNT